MRDVLLTLCLLFCNTSPASHQYFKCFPVCGLLRVFPLQYGYLHRQLKLFLLSYRFVFADPTVTLFSMDL